MKKRWESRPDVRAQNAAIKARRYATDAAYRERRDQVKEAWRVANPEKEYINQIRSETKRKRNRLMEAMDVS